MRITPDDRPHLRDVGAALVWALTASALALAVAFALGCIFIGPPPMIDALLP